MSMTKTFRDFGIEGVRMNATGRQSVRCPKCKGTARTNLTVWASKGTWACAVCNWKGSLFTTAERRTSYKPVELKSPLTAPSAPQLDWMQSRGITEAVVKRNRIAKASVWFPEAKEQQAGVAACFAFPYYVGDTIVNVKYRDAHKRFMQTSGGERVLYKINDLEDATTAIICEGEMDALSFEVAGYANAVSVPDGAPSPTAKNLDTKLAFLDTSFDLVQHIEKWIIATDSDEAGQALAHELARRLGRQKCYMLHFPKGCKDANDVLVQHGADALRLLVENATAYPIEGAVEPKEYFSALDLLYENGYPDGARTMVWQNFDDHFKWYKDMMTVVTGTSSHGKTSWVDNLVVRLNESAGWKTAFFTPENSPAVIHMERLVSIIAGGRMTPNYNTRIEREEYEEAKRKIDGNFFYIQPENFMYTLDNIRMVIEYYVRAKGVKMIVIDPWNSIVHRRERDQSEQDYIAEALWKVKNITRELGVHIIVIAHPRKTSILKQTDDGTVNYSVPNLMDIAGSVHWYNVPDNGIIVYRNKLDRYHSETHVIIEKVKHHFIGREGRVLFQMDTASQRFNEMTGQTAAISTAKSYDVGF